MPTISRIGNVRIAVDGAWDIDDLRHLSEALSETYGLFYPLVAADEAVANKLHDLLRKQFWSGDIDTRYFGAFIYREVPDAERLKLKSFQYASPGFMELSGVLAVLLMLSRVARSWIKTGEEFISLWERVDKFFEKRKSLRRPPRKTMLDDDMALSADEARKLVFELGGKLGFDELSCERLIEIAGNPISTLKFLVMAGREGRKLANLQNEGLLHLPSPVGDEIVLASPAKGKQYTRGGVEVVKAPRRKKGNPSPSKGS